MKFRLLALVFANVIVGVTSLAQSRQESFTIDGYVFNNDQIQLTRPIGECTESLSRISITHDGSKIFEISVCSVDPEDVQFIQKGYLSVLEHYSRPVGWSEYIIFDLCKKRIIFTKRIDEGETLHWEEFVELKKSFSAKYVAKIQDFK